MFKLLGLFSLISFLSAKLGYKEYYHNKCNEYELELLKIGFDRSFLDMLLFAPNTTYKDYYHKLKDLNENINSHRNIVYVILNNYSSNTVNQLFLNSNFGDVLRESAVKLSSTPLSVNEYLIIKEYL